MLLSSVFFVWLNRLICKLIFLENFLIFQIILDFPLFIYNCSTHTLTFLNDPGVGTLCSSCDIVRNNGIPFSYSPSLSTELERVSLFLLQELKKIN